MKTYVIGAGLRGHIINVGAVHAHDSYYLQLVRTVIKILNVIQLPREVIRFLCRHLATSY